MRGRTLCIASISAAFLCVAGWFGVRSLHPRVEAEPQEPTFQGQNLSQWLGVYYNGFSKHSGESRWATREEQEAAINAIKKMGTNTIPILIEWLSKKNSRQDGNACSMALTVCKFLKEQARPAGPQLAELVTHSKDEETRWYAFLCLKQIDSERNILIPVLTTLVHDPDKNLSYYATEALATLDPLAAQKTGAFELHPSLRPEEIDKAQPLSQSTSEPPERRDPDAVPRRESQETEPERALTIRDMTVAPEEYRKKALSLLIGEASRVAQELHLLEQLPIAETNLVAYYITPPSLAQGMRALGNITTTNYAYYASIDNKFAFLERRLAQQELAELRMKNLWPMGRLDTNAAYTLATQFLCAVSMDVAALTRDCEVEIRAWTPEGVKGANFVPLYWVNWKRASKVVATVELFEPTKVLRQLRVKESQYILRNSLEIRDAVLIERKAR